MPVPGHIIPGKYNVALLHGRRGPEVVLYMDALTGGVEPLCDVCNRNQYPCRCRLAKDDIIIGCKYFIRAVAPKPTRRKLKTDAIDAECPGEDLNDLL